LGSSTYLLPNSKSSKNPEAKPLDYPNPKWQRRNKTDFGWEISFGASFGLLILRTIWSSKAKCYWLCWNNPVAVLSILIYVQFQRSPISTGFRYREWFLQVDFSHIFIVNSPRDLVNLPDRSGWKVDYVFRFSGEVDAAIHAGLERTSFVRRRFLGSGQKLWIQKDLAWLLAWMQMNMLGSLGLASRFVSVVMPLILN